MLGELGIDEARRSHIIEVWNKLDLLARQKNARPALRKPSAQANCALISAVTGEGLDRLLADVENRLGAGHTVYEFVLEPSRRRRLAWLHECGEVLSRAADDNGHTHLQVRLTADKAGQATSRFGTAMKTMGTQQAAE